MTSNNVLDRLKNLSENIEDLKSRKSKLEGKREQLLSQLKEKFDVESLEDAERLLKELEGKRKRLENSILNIVEELERVIGEYEKIS